MARYIPNTYKNRRVARILVRVVVVVVVATVILAVSLFFGLRRYIVYTPEGLRLEIPWLQEEPTASPLAEIEITNETPDYTSGVSFVFIS